MVKLDYRQIARDTVLATAEYLESIADRISTEIFKGDIQDSVIIATGNEPFYEKGLDEFIEKLGGNIDDDTPWEHVDYVVIGRERFDEDYLQSAAENNAEIVFISQEEFINMVIFDPELDLEDEERINQHPGLKIVAEYLDE